jgi:hypothetical protein
MTWSHIPWNPPARTLRQFAALGSLLLGILAVYEWSADRLLLAAILTGTGAVVGLVGLFRPFWLRPIFVGWLVLVFPIGWLMLHVCLAVVYFGIITPLGLVFRLWGRDPLHLSSDRGRDSYWQTKPAPPVSNYYKTF